MYPFDLLQQAADSLPTPPAFAQGHPSEINTYAASGSFPVVWALEGQQYTSRTRVKQGLYRINLQFLLVDKTKDIASGRNASSGQASKAMITATCGRMEILSQALSYAMQYDITEIGFSEFTWQEKSVQMDSTGLLSGVMVMASMLVREEICFVGFDRVATPLILGGGIYEGVADLVITTPTAGASIYYTTDGTLPTPQNGTFFTGSPVLLASAFVRARAFLSGLLPSLTATATFTIVPIALQITPAAGSYLGEVTAEILNDTVGVDMFFTVDGSTPTQLSTPYVGALLIEQNTDLAAIGFKPPALPSAVVRSLFSIEALAPLTATDSGAFTSSRIVAFTNPNPYGAIELSINGGAFAAATQFDFTETGYVVARVTSPNQIASATVRRDIEILVAPITISPNGGIVSDADEITLTTATSGASIYYTIDGTNPTISSLLYNPATKPILAASATFKAKGFKPGTTATATNTVDFLIVSAAAALFLSAAGITDPTITAAITTFVHGLQADGIWNRMFAIYPFVGGTAATHKFNLKDPRDLDAAYRLTFAGPFIHSALGVQPNSTNQPANSVAYAHANTFFKAEIINTLDGLSYGFDARTQLIFRGVQPTLIGSTLTQINVIDNVMATFGGPNARYFINEHAPFVNTNAFSTSSSIFFALCSRNRTTGVFRYSDFNDSIQSVTRIEPPAVLNGLELFLFASNTGSGRQNGSQSEQRCAFAFIGNDLTFTELINLRSRYFTMRTALNR